MKRKLVATYFLVLILLVVSACTGKDKDAVVLGQYKGIEVNAAEPETITDEDVDAEIARILNDSQALVGITEKAVAEGDLVNIDYEGYLDGEVISESSIADYNVLIGSGVFFDGAESQLIGALPGETREINVTFPQGYPDASLVGKTAVYKVTVNSIQVDEIPELTDEFVRSISDSETVEAFRQELFDMLTKAAESKAEVDKIDAVWSQVMDNAQIISYPENQLEKIVADYEALGEEEAREYAKEVTGLMLVVTAIANEEGLSGEEISDEEMMRCAKNNGYDSVEAYQEDYIEEEIRQEVLYYRVTDFIVSAAKVVKGE